MPSPTAAPIYTPFYVAAAAMPGPDTVWSDRDLTGIIPAVAKTLLLSLGCSGVANQILGARKNGDTETPMTRVVNNNSTTILCNVPTTLIIELYADTKASAEYTILGYYA